MVKKRSGVKEIDVSGGGSIDERGRFINKDIPEEARRSGSKSKSNAKKRLKQKKDQSDKRKQDMIDEDEASKPTSKIKKRRKRKEDDPTVLDVEKEKKKKRKTKADAAKLAEKEEEKAKGKKKKKKKKTVGELLAEGKTDKARKKMQKLASKSMVLADSTAIGVEHEVIEGQGHFVEANINSEAEFLQEYYHIYATLGSIIRNLEHKMTQPKSEVNSKDVYALMTMYSQMRETIADLRSIKDMNEQAEELAQHVFDPAAKSAGESLVSLYFKVSSTVRQKVDDPAIVEAILETLKLDVADQANKLQEQFAIARSRVADILNGGV